MSEEYSNAEPGREFLNRALKLSELTRIYSHYEGNRNLVVSNTSGASAIVEDKVIDLLQKFKEPICPSELDESQEELLLDLYRAEILIDADKTGFSILGEKIRRMKDRPELDIIPVVTTKCNLACPYCFEGSPGQKSYMDEKLVNRIVDYSAERIQNEDIRKVYSSLYGGEPLLNKKACYLFLEKMSREAERLDVHFEPAVITNGTLIDRDFLEFISQYNIFYVQVTIDGPKEIHDQRRIFKGGKGSYDIIVRKLAMITDYVKLQLRVNVDKTNVGKIPSLIEDLKSRGLNHKGVSIDLAQVVANTPQNIKYNSKCIDAEHYDHEILPYIKQLKKAGFTVFIHPTNKPRYIYCAAYSGKHIAVDPDGNLFTCLEGMGNPHFIVGNIWETPMYNSRYDEWKSVSTLNFEKCRNCDVIGFCGGGCGAEALAQFDNSLSKGLVCPPVKWSYVGGVVLPADLRRELEEV